MFSLSSPHPLSLSSTTSTFLSPHPLPPLRPLHFRPPPSSVISAASNSPPPINLIIPKNAGSAGPQPQNLYQPYRPPPSPPPEKYRTLDTAAIIDVLSNRLGLWYEYAPLISNLFRDGFNPPSIEELTGISGVEQNRLVVAAQVRESIAASPDLDPDTLSFFETGGSELLYEIRLLSASQRVAAANYVVKNKLDGEKARDVARAIKDFPSRQLVPGWNRFDYTKPGDCWAFTFFRQSREFPKNSEKRTAALTTALEVAETEEAKVAVKEEMEGKPERGEEKKDDGFSRVPVVRLQLGEVAEATSVVVLPVCKAEEREDGLLRAPFECRAEGEFGVVVSDKGWDRWVVLPKWVPVAGIGPGGVAVAFPNARALPWRVNRSYEKESLLVVVDRATKAVASDEGFYLVADNGGDEAAMKVMRGSTLKQRGVTESLGMVLIVVRPPRDEDDRLSDDDWD
uniref:Rubisco accumulation factor 1 C-terminal domain-containing protein n=1 Tax=Opuntia streptacantha TaxID=393608 RepID=A0A7C9AB55_OPUST